MDDGDWLGANSLARTTTTTTTTTMTKEPKLTWWIPNQIKKKWVDFDWTGHYYYYYYEVVRDLHLMHE